MQQTGYMDAKRNVLALTVKGLTSAQNISQVWPVDCLPEGGEFVKGGSWSFSKLAEVGEV